MKPDTILYVDDEPMSLKYFERLVSPLAPVLTASSVTQGRQLLRERAHDIAVLVCDQRMPGERGTELLRHARSYYPHVVRIMTTAYSELEEAVDAINTGEIYRYISKPWELEHLRSDMRNALELAQLRMERDTLARDKLLAQHSQLMAHRLTALFTLGSVWWPRRQAPVVHGFVRAALTTDLSPPAVDWKHWEHADLMQAEAWREAALAGAVQACWQRWGTGPGQGAASQLLAQAWGIEGGDGPVVRLNHPAPLQAWLTEAAGSAPDAAASAWIAWLMAQQGGVVVAVENGVWVVRPTSTWPPTPVDWLAESIDRLGPAQL